MVEALKKLHDIHLPAPISFWPPAPGYFIMASLFLLLSIVFFIYFYTQKTRVIKRTALEQLSEISKAHEAGTTGQQTAAQISTLLKQVALLYYSRETVASLQGEAWVNFLTKSSKKLNFKSVQHTLVDLPFHPDANESLTLLLSLTKQWIKQRGIRCLN